MHWASGTSVPSGDFALHATINYADLTTETTSMSFQKGISIGEQFLTATIVPKQASQTWGSNYIDFLYDESGSAYSFIYNGTQYYYVCNLQGDVVKILNTSGAVVASYTYDAWGKVTSSGSIGQINPIRYRGYYYDTDTGFYYLQSRYYDPTVKRFISADDTSLIGANGDFISFNLYAYCLNNPINSVDPNGNSALAIGIFIGTSAIIGGLAGAITAACTGGNVLEGALEGVALGAIAATATVLAPIVSSFILPAASTTAMVAATTAATGFTMATAGGMAVDACTQVISHEFSDTANEDFVLDKARLIKTGFTTGIASLVSTYGNPAKEVVNAIGSTVIGFDASFVNATIEIVIVNVLSQR